MGRRLLVISLAGVVLAAGAVSLAVALGQQPPKAHSTAGGCPPAPHNMGGLSVKSANSSLFQPHPISWIIGAGAIQQLLRTGATRHLIDTAFANGRSYVYGPRPATIGVPTAYYTSYAGIKAAFQRGGLPGGYKAVIYDNERWAGTPVSEQVNPQLYDRLAAELVHEHGLIFIATPAPDLTWATGNPGEDSYQAFLQRSIPGTAARYANVVDIQSQIREIDLPRFVTFVRAGISQVRRFNPHADALVGLRDDPRPYTGTAATLKLYAAYDAVAGLGDGYWLNVNGYPRPAVCLLRQIYGPH